MVPGWQRRFVRALRTADRPQIQGAEMRLLDSETLGVDAYGLLAMVHVDHTGARSTKAFFSPSGSTPGEFIYQDRDALLRDTQLTPAQLTQLLTWNDDGLSFDDIADAIEAQWAVA